MLHNYIAGTEIETGLLVIAFVFRPKIPVCRQAGYKADILVPVIVIKGC